MSLINKKNLIGLAVIVLAVLVVYFLSWAKKPSAPFYNEMRGTVRQVSNQSFVAQGYLIDVPKDQKQLVEVTFQINSETKLIKTVRVINTTKNKPGEFFTPEERPEPGNFSDIKPNSTLRLVKSKTNLYNTKEAVAEEINYIVTVYEK